VISPSPVELYQNLKGNELGKRDGFYQLNEIEQNLRERFLLQGLPLVYDSLCLIHANKSERYLCPYLVIEPIPSLI
jgi:hypothetical protein